MNKPIYLFQLVLVLLAAIFARNTLLAETPFVAATGISGAWYDPERDGEGFLAELPGETVEKLRKDVSLKHCQGQVQRT